MTKYTARLLLTSVMIYFGLAVVWEAMNWDVVVLGEVLLGLAVLCLICLAIWGPER